VGKSSALFSLSQRTEKLLKDITSFAFPEGNSPEQFRTVSVSDPDSVSVSVSEGAKTATYLLDVDRIAESKTINSKLLSENDTTDLSGGTHPFNLVVDDTTYSLSIDVDRSGSDPDTNRDVLAKLERAVGSADSRVETEIVSVKRKVYSTVSDNLFEDMVYLSVKAEDTGQAADFTLSDTTGSIIEDLGLDIIAVPGTDAHYSINNQSATSSTNSVSLDNGFLKIDLAEQSGTPVRIKVENGFSALENRINGIVNDYSSYISWLNTNKEDFSTMLTDDIPGKIKLLEDDLESIGIKLSSDNTLMVTDSFDETLRNRTDSVRRVLTGSKGLFPTILSELSAISDNISKAGSQAGYNTPVYGSLDLFA
jgi:flagellar capping protein FliD